MDEEEVYVEVKARLSSFIGQVMDDDGLLTVCVFVWDESPVSADVRGSSGSRARFVLICASGPYRRKLQIQYKYRQCQRRSIYRG